MATMLLAAVGAAAGGSLGGVGAMIGQAIGGVAGAVIDQTLLRSSRTVTGSRLSDLDVQSSTEGETISRVYGRARLAGQVIWATRHEETAVVTHSGGKGGVTTKDYRYYANFAVGLCEGPIHRVGRVWADGTLIDTTAITMRVHLGTEDQEPDALILARQGGAVPAYRGLAHVVFERLPLADWGNRIPSLTFEVIRVVDTLEAKVKAVTMIPGSTEFGYDTVAVSRTSSAGVTASENRHATSASTDFLASLDELCAVCPNLERVALVVSWFGGDLRAAECRVRPAVDAAAKKSSPRTWSVAGLARDEAHVVSSVGGRSAYGGTPSDESVAAAIAAIRARGLKVTLYPFLSMDIPAGNGLPDPRGGTQQPAHPWRGRITCHPAPGHAGTPDRTATADAQIAAFVGAATIADHRISGGGVVYSGAPEWTLRRMLLHYAFLAKAAGGVDAFLLGSEFVGLTTVRGSGDAYPFVAALARLADDLRAVLGGGTRIGSGADWSEWFGHHPSDGSGDVRFHLDPLWASPAVDFVGIDAYFPLTDWRWTDHLDATLADGPTDRTHLDARIAGGEGWDWYYADDAARRDQIRTPIRDTAHGEDWIFRPKDLLGWWSNAHHERIGGVRSVTPTAWVAGMKPIWFTELGCPAVDLGCNQPNVFPDPKSSESGLPWFAIGTRDDFVQRRTLETILDHWDPTAHPATNPVSPLYGGPMLALDGVHLWTWDARPFPAFPTETDVWADGASWATGHWLQGRLGGVSIEGLIRAVLADHAIATPEFRAVGGHVDGFVVDTRQSARDTLDPLLAAFLVDALDTGLGLRFSGRARRADLALRRDELVAVDEEALAESRRGQESELPLEVSLTFSDAALDFRRTTVSSRRLAGAARRASSAEVAVVAPVETMVGVADAWLADVWAGRTAWKLAVDPTRLALEPGDLVDLAIDDRLERMFVESITDTTQRAIEARSHDAGLYGPVRAVRRDRRGLSATVFGRPVVEILDIAHTGDDATPHRPWIAAFASPWPGSLSIWRRVEEASWNAVGTIDRPAVIGITLDAFWPGPAAVWDRAGTLDVLVYGGTLASAAETAVLGGANRAAVRAPSGTWEVFQFATATLIAASTWRLADLLRVQGGSDDVWTGLDEIPAGATFVLLDERVALLPTGVDDIGRALTFRIGPVRDDYTSDAYVETSVTPTGRGLVPWSPAHLSARADPVTGDVAISWIRRSRAAGSDSWATVDVPLDEATEAHRLEILVGATVVKAVDTTAANWTWPRADRDAALGASPCDVTIRVAQIGATLGPGIARTLFARI